MDKLNENEDVKYKTIHTSKGILTLIFIESITDKVFINNYIITPLLQSHDEILSIEMIKNKILLCSSVLKILPLDDYVHHILSGNVLILSSFSVEIIICNARKTINRPIEKSINEPVSKGSQEAFNESINDNINLIRRRIRNQSLKIEEFQLGTNSNTTVILLYIKDRAPEDLVNLFKDAINNLKIDFILDTNYIEEELKCKGTNFDTIGYTERPDVLASKLFEGRVAILVDNCPNAITAPYFFLEYFHIAEDYYLNKNVVDNLRVLRLICLKTL